jgi:hypothetical protein
VQSLARGIAGTALLRVEQALNRTGTWAGAHAALTAAADGPADAGPRASLFYGTPALAFVLHAARADGQPRYQAATTALQSRTEEIARQRLAAASARMASGTAGTFNEHDLVYGLTGIGVVLLRTAPASSSLGAVLAYLTRLATTPLILDGDPVPGWWSARDPDPLVPTPGGHANFGMAHGAAGLLAFLSLAAISGRTVEGQYEAIASLSSWFDTWRQETAGGPWWPEWITRAGLRAGRPDRQGPGRPSWCYGSAGITRALQLAAIAAGDTARQAAAEHAMAACLSGPQLARITDPGLCHGAAGIYQTAVRAAADAVTPVIVQVLPGLTARLIRQAGTPPPTASLLTGSAGIALATETVLHQVPCSGWDSCLLIA